MTQHIALHTPQREKKKKTNLEIRAFRDSNREAL